MLSRVNSKHVHNRIIATPATKDPLQCKCLQLKTPSKFKYYAINDEIKYKNPHLQVAIFHKPTGWLNAEGKSPQIVTRNKT